MLADSPRGASFHKVRSDLRAFIAEVRVRDLKRARIRQRIRREQMSRTEGSESDDW